MARSSSEHPTELELQILKGLWEQSSYGITHPFSRPPTDVELSCYLMKRDTIRRALHDHGQSEYVFWFFISHDYGFPDQSYKLNSSAP